MNYSLAITLLSLGALLEVNTLPPHENYLPPYDSGSVNKKPVVDCPFPDPQEII